MDIEEITLTPEQYIEELKKVQHTLEGVKEDLDRAIYKMERRIETGYENLERKAGWQHWLQRPLFRWRTVTF